MESDREKREKILETGTKEEIAEHLASLHPDPMAREEVIQGLLKMDRAALVKYIRDNTYGVVKAPLKNCLSCGNPMEFESGCSGRRTFGILGKYACYSCMRFELLTEQDATKTTSRWH